MVKLVSLFVVSENLPMTLRTYLLKLVIRERELGTKTQYRRVRGWVGVVKITTQRILFQKRNQFCLHSYYIRDQVVEIYPASAHRAWKVRMKVFEVELPSIDTKSKE